MTLTAHRPLNHRQAFCPRSVHTVKELLLVTAVSHPHISLPGGSRFIVRASRPPLMTPLKIDSTRAQKPPHVMTVLTIAMVRLETGFTQTSTSGVAGKVIKPVPNS